MRYRLRKILVLSSILLFSDYYFMFENIRINALFMFVPALSYFLIDDPLLLRSTKCSCMNKDTRKILFAVFVFLLYMFILDIFRGQDLAASIVDVLSSLLVVSMLPVFEYNNQKFNLITWYKRILFVSIVFAIMQFVGFDFIFGDIFKGVGPLGVDRIVQEFTSNYSRTTGATSNTVAFAIQLCFLFFVYYFFWIKRVNLSTGLFLVFIGFVLVTTQARAAILAIFPSLCIMQILVSKNRLRDCFFIFTVFSVMGGIYWIFGDQIMSNMSYLGKNIDKGDTHRFWVNWYMTLGVLKESPIFGISPQEAWNVYLQYGDVSIYAFNPDIKTPTHHNQLGFYFRYYGIVGVCLFLWIYTLIFKKIKNSKSSFSRFVLGGFFLLDFIYSMAHNNKIFSNPLLWILLSLASLLSEEKDCSSSISSEPFFE